MTRPSVLRAVALGLATLVPLTACSLLGDEEPTDRGGMRYAKVVLLTHESFSLPKEMIRDFDNTYHAELVIRASGDAGTLTNKLVLSQGNPQGDVAFGVDNTFASRALDADVFAPYDATLPAGAEA